MKQYKNIIFDVDGTLWDTTEECAVIWSQVAGKYPQVTDTVTPAKLKKLYGKSLEEIAGLLFASVPYELGVKIMTECVTVQCPILEKKGARLLGDLKTVFEKLTADGYRLFIVSNCKSGYIESFLTAHKLGKWITDFTCPGETGLLKADNIKLICERNHLSLSETVYVGDTDGDGIAAHTAGVPFVFCEYGFGESEEYDYAIDSIESLPTLFT